MFCVLGGTQKFSTFHAVSRNQGANLGLLGTTSNKIIAALKTTLGEKMHFAKRFSFYDITLSRYMTSNPPNFWRFSQLTTREAPYFLIGNHITRNAFAISNSFSKYFRMVYKDHNRNFPQFTLNVDSSLPHLTLSVEGIINLILKVDPEKSSRLDSISNKFLIRYSKWVAQYLSLIFKK